MGRRKKARTQPAGQPRGSLALVGSDVPVRPGPELLRRVLLGLITALIVARPLVLGEDPGLLARLSDASNLVLSLLWLVAAVGWAAWRAWSRQGTWSGSAVEAGLSLVVILVGVSVANAGYKHPAYLIACEWAVLLAAFCLVRQLTRTRGDNHRLLAAILASGVSLAAYAIFQYHVDMPDQAQSIREKLAEYPPDEAKRILETDPYVKRVLATNAYGTFAHPNAFAGYLALLLPGWVGALLVCARRPPVSVQTVLVAGGTLLTGIGLWLTHSRGAILACLLVAAAAGACWLLAIFRNQESGIRGPRTRWLLALLVLLPPVLILGAWLIYGRQGFDLARQSLGKRLDYWSATWQMITDGKHPRQFWLGVGPGNFGRHYLRYMAPTADEQIQDPHNFLLESWATSGVFAMAALTATLGLFFWATRRAWSPLLRHGLETTPQQLPPEPEIQFATRWEFYLGGMAGMILGFVFSPLTPSSNQEALINGVVASGRAILWFATFALLETVPWTTFARRLALTAGVAALLLNLTVSGGIAFSSVAQPLWVMAALALNTLPPHPLQWGDRHGLGLFLPLPVLAAGCLVYTLFILVPISRGLSYLSEATRYYSDWPKLDQEWRAKIKEGPDSKDRLAVTNRNKAWLDKHILANLRKAVEEDRENVHALTDLASWYAERWKLAPSIPLRQNTDALLHLVTTRLDPDGLDGYRTQREVNILFAQFSDPASASEFYEKAMQAMAEVVKRDPTSVQFRYQYIDALMKNEKTVEARLQIQECLDLDRLAGEPSRKLTSPQREQIQKWLDALPHG